MTMKGLVVAAWAGFRRVVERPREEQWERWVTLALGVSAVLSAAVTWMGVTVGSDARDGDRKVISQSVSFEQIRALSVLQAAAEQSEGVSYIRDVREAQALTAASGGSLEPVVRAHLLDAMARDDGFSFDATYLDPLTNTFLGARREKAIEESVRATLIDPEPTERVQGQADSAHLRSGVLAWLVAAVLTGTFLLTVARLAAPSWRPVLVLTIGLLGVGAVTGSLVAAW